ncbi:MAG: flagellar FlbD family protein [Vampirovibrionales bacterium]
MLELSRLNGSVYFLNPDWVLTVEATPDTVIRLKDGEILMVKESVDEVRERFTAYYQRLHQPLLHPPVSAL